MHHFHSLKVKKARVETNDCIHLVFEVPESLRPLYRYRAGQYLTLRKLIDGEDVRRSYSIVSAPREEKQDVDVLVKKLPGGKMSSFIHSELKEGDEVEVLSPIGHFYTNYHPTNEKYYIGLAAGSGISPVISNLKEALLEEPLSKAYLFFSNRSYQDIIFKSDLEELGKKFEGRLKVVYLLSRDKHLEDELFEGRITSEKLDTLLEKFSDIPVKEATYFLCGPSEMIKSLTQHLKSGLKVPSLQVLYEYYAAPEEEGAAEMSDEFKAIANIESMVTVIIDDDEYSFHLNSKKNSILEEAIKEKLPVPFACKGGVCCTCKAQVLEGEIFMEKNFALTEKEVENGYVLTCQAHPTTNVVLLNYDV